MSKLPVVAGASAALLLVGCMTHPTSVPPLSATDPGESPTEAQTQEAVLGYLMRTLKDPDSLKQFQITQWPTRAYWRTGMLGMDFGSGWLVCYEFNAKNSYGGYVGVKREGIMLKRAGDIVYALDNVNWATSSGRCY